MKHLLFILCVLLISSCGIFRRTQHIQREEKTLITTGSETQKAEVDTSTRLTTEHWKLTLPAMDKPVLPAWQPGPVPDLTNVSKEFKDSYLELRDQYKKLSDQQFAKGWNAATLELSRSILDKVGKTTTEVKKDSALKASIIKDDKVTKDPVIPQWAWAGPVILAGIILIQRFSKSK